MSVVLRVTGDPAAIGTALRRAVAEIDPRVPVSRVRTMDGIVAASAQHYVPSDYPRMIVKALMSCCKDWGKTGDPVPPLIARQFCRLPGVNTLPKVRT